MPDFTYVESANSATATAEYICAISWISFICPSRCELIFMTNAFGTQPPLAGIKVIEIAMAMAGPFCGMMLADYGADVIKIERTGEGDESRRWAPFFPGHLSHYFAA